MILSSNWLSVQGIASHISGTSYSAILSTRTPPVVGFVSPLLKARVSHGIAGSQHLGVNGPYDWHNIVPKSPLLMKLIATSDDGDVLAASTMSLWLDMRTAVLPASQTMQVLYNDLRERELSRGQTPDDEDWALSRVPDPVGALMYADNPKGRAADESEALRGTLRCLVLDADNRVVDVTTGAVVGAGLNPSTSQGQGPNVAVEVAMRSPGKFLLLQAVRPSNWTDDDMPNVLHMTASACAGAGKTLVITVRTVGQVHDAAMATLAASQTKLLGQAGSGSSVALLIEPVAELWEAGMLYLR